jgi:hypothetical protein
MAANLKKTSIVSPTMAVELVWAATGKFSNDSSSQMLATSIPSREQLESKAKDSNDPDEIKYTNQALAFMDASLRNIEIAYKGRELNFEENRKLREAYLDKAKENIEFGSKANDILKSLPTMAVSSAGSITVIQAIAPLFGSGAAQYINDNPVIIWAIGLAFAGFGYWVNVAYKKHAKKSELGFYIRQDYERTLYYHQYLGRAMAILRSLYLDVERVHKEIFKQPYGDDVNRVILELINANKPEICPLIHKHMAYGVITSELWPMCDSGVQKAYVKCPLWKKDEADIEAKIEAKSV